MEASILGLGPSLKDYKPNGRITFGVNDIFRFYPVDHLIVQNYPRQFDAERLEVINNSRPKVLHTSLKDWDNHPCYREMDMLGPRGGLDFDSTSIAYSFFSPFCAMDMAVKMGAKNITVYGVDLIGHHALGLPDKLRHCVEHIRKFIDLCPVPVFWADSSPLGIHIFDEAVF